MAMAAGIAAGGGKPVYGVYQHLYRELTTRSHRICASIAMQQQFVTFWGSVYGMNDVTHLGLQDIPMMRQHS